MSRLLTFAAMTTVLFVVLATGASVHPAALLSALATTKNTAAASGKTVKVRVFNSTDCVGNYTESPVPLDQCLPGKNNSVLFKDKVTSGSACLGMSIFAAPDCNQSTYAYEVMDLCGVCTKDPDPKMDYYLVECSVKRQVVILNGQCDSTCIHCNINMTVGPGSCQNAPVPVGTWSDRIKSIKECGHVTVETFDAGSSCGGTPVTTNPMIFGFCDSGSMYMA